jgi:hypothetical protein
LSTDKCQVGTAASRFNPCHPVFPFSYCADLHIRLLVIQGNIYSTQKPPTGLSSEDQHWRVHCTPSHPILQSKALPVWTMGHIKLTIDLDCTSNFLACASQVCSALVLCFEAISSFTCLLYLLLVSSSFHGQVSQG